MPDNRKFGTRLSANSEFSHQFNEAQKAAMCEAKSHGESYRKVAEEFHTVPSTVHRIVKRYENNNTLRNRPRKGAPKKLTEAEERQITWDALVNEVDGKVCSRTIRRALEHGCRRKWKAMERIEISEETAEERLEFARHWEGNEEELMEV
ncbi:hypothetical protein PT974_10008 [Cladobotryum mycophilum]|uniref:Transposase Tc1-like domain-containing protein n=1 Tax=Cladobotryum mycophilum TaxID=491253 RepID=A0ABR0S8N3_9HYPO